MARAQAIEKEDSIISYCSWCLTRSKHTLVEQNYLSRNVYQCDNCHNFTVQCRVCDCMAKGSPLQKEAESFLQKVKEGWNSEYCAAHDGSIPSWDKLHVKIKTPDQFRKICERDNEWNMVKVTGGVVGSVAVAGAMLATMGAAAGPLAAALGSTGLLGASGTGTAIATLNGAALTSASLAAIGMGSMATGGLIVSAAGGALGSGLGLALSNNYLGELEEFDIRCVEKGDVAKPAILFINGFLQQDSDVDDWLQSVDKRFPDNPKYHVNWDSKNLRSLFGIIGTQGSPHMAKALVTRGAMKTLPLAWVSALADAARNPWHTALYNAGKTGALLADIITRTTAHKKYIIMGHSLGCRVAYYAARALATQKKRRIESLYLLSGAVGVNEWKEISEDVDEIYNFYAPGDVIVGPIYKAASMGLAEDTIGIRPIAHEGSNIHNFDVSDILEENDSSLFYHMCYKDAFDTILEKYDV